MQTLFVTGTGTDVGKTVAAAIVAAALGAEYWKPVQAGIDGTDTLTVQSMVPGIVCHPEVYRLGIPASPHFSAREEGITIEPTLIKNRYDEIYARESSAPFLLVEGAGGLLVPLAPDFFVADLVVMLGAPVLLVSRNYLGSINHSMLTAIACKAMGIKVTGWLFNGHDSGYEEEISSWSGYPLIAKLPQLDHLGPDSISAAASILKPQLMKILATG